VSSFEMLRRKGKLPLKIGLLVKSSNATKLKTISRKFSGLRKLKMLSKIPLNPLKQCIRLFPLRSGSLSSLNICSRIPSISTPSSFVMTLT
jgi:hypothetical protein